MDNSKTILREGYVYKEDMVSGQDDVLYFILKANTLSFHRRKVHKRHTPLGLLKLETICTESTEGCEDELDCNANPKRFSWRIMASDRKMFLYCATSEERSSWLASIKEAKDRLSNCSRETGPGNTHLKDQSDCKSESLKANNGDGSVLVEKNGDGDPLIISKSVYNTSHSMAGEDNSVGTGDHHLSDASERKSIRRLRSRSLSELIDSESRTEDELRPLKSNSAPPEGGNSKRAFKTVDKLIDVHSIWCRQLVRWI